MVVTILTWTAFGVVVGAIARALHPGGDAMGWGAAIVLGLTGSFLGGVLGHLLFGLPALAGLAPIHPIGLFGSVFGAMLALVLVQTARGRQRYA